MQGLKIVYLGTPDFAVAPLKKLLQLPQVEVIAVVCNHDKPVGRKRVMTPPPVKTEALKHGIPVCQYRSIRKEGAEDMRKLAPDLMVTCAFGQILSQEIIDVPKFGILNIHGSLLPAYRGASPIQHAVLNGEKQTGITIMRTDIGIDTGDILLQKAIPIADDDTAGDVFEKLSPLGAECIAQAINLIEEDKAVFVPQDESAATHTGMIRKEDAYIDFNESAKVIVNKVRGYNPSPMAYTLVGGEPFKIYKAGIAEGSGFAGEILKADKELKIACKEGAVTLLCVQRSGGKPLDIAEYLRGTKLEVGTKFND